MVTGDLWSGGFTASLTVTYNSDQFLDYWALSFTNPRGFYGEAWGVDVVTEQLSGDLYRYQLTGIDFGESTGVGASRTVGFNAMADTELDQSGFINENIQLAAGTNIAAL